MDEFDLIRKYFAPLVTSRGADGLRDDVAEIDLPGGGGRLIVTQDAMVEGVHFLPGDPIDTVARKLVRVNVSDVIAKGAHPDAALLSLIWPQGRPGEDVAPFAHALGDDLAHWGAHLVGGDTTSTDGPLTLSLTLLGKAGARGPVRRSGAAAGEDVWVSGTIGDGWLGLQAARDGMHNLNAAARADLVARYRVPQPPSLAVADLVASLAGASIDVSDGLVADAGHIAESSGVRLVLHALDIPLSKSGRTFVTDSAGDIRSLLTGGDDYQTLFTAPPAHRDAIKDSGLALTRIGVVERGAGVSVLGAGGEPLDIASSGWRHFAQ